MLPPGVPVQHVVVGGSTSRKRLVDFDRADVGQAVGRLRAGAGAELANPAGGQWISGGERRIGDVVAQGDDAVGVEQPTAGRGVDRGEDSGCRPFSRSPATAPATPLPNTLWPLLNASAAPAMSGPPAGSLPSLLLPATMVLLSSTSNRSGDVEATAGVGATMVTGDRAVANEQRPGRHDPPAVLRRAIVGDRAVGNGDLAAGTVNAAAIVWPGSRRSWCAAQ